MIVLRKSSDRGQSQHGWLTSSHTFSFSEYYDPEHMGFGHLRVINEDFVAAGKGFSTHPHRDMEILSYVISGALEHKDSMGNGSIIKPGEIQVMSAGSGVTHSEFNHSSQEQVHFLQIWIEPNVKGIAPSYQQTTIPTTENEWHLIASGEKTQSAVFIHQDVKVFTAFLTANHHLTHENSAQRMVWLHIVSGVVMVNSQKLTAGDAVGVQNELLEIHCTQDANILLFSLLNLVEKVS